MMSVSVVSGLRGLCAQSRESGESRGSRMGLFTHSQKIDLLDGSLE